MAKKETKKKTPSSKKARPTIRFEPAVHARLAKVALDFGMSVNSVVSYLVLRGLGRLELEAQVYRTEMEERDLYEKMESWVRAKPGRSRKQFILGMKKRLMNEPSRQSALPDATSGEGNHPPVEVADELLDRLAREAHEAAIKTASGTSDDF